MVIIVIVIVLAVASVLLIIGDFASSSDSKIESRLASYSAEDDLTVRCQKLKKALEYQCQAKWCSRMAWVVLAVAILLLVVFK